VAACQQILGNRRAGECTGAHSEAFHCEKEKDGTEKQGVSPCQTNFYRRAKMKKTLTFLAFAVITAAAVFAQSGTEDLDKEIADYTQAIRINPNNVDAYNNRGIAYGRKGDYDRAIADFNQAIRLNSNYTEAYVSRGVAYHDKGDYDRAIADFNQAIRINPNYANARDNPEILRKEGH
jgi:tetratricopeptide (TPR) repeat protein